MTVAALGLKVESGSIPPAVSGLEKLTRAAGEAQRAAEKLGQASSKGFAEGISQSAAAMGLWVDKAGKLRNALGQFATDEERAKAASLGLTQAINAQTAATAKLLAANDNLAAFRRRNLTYQLFDVTQGIGLSGGDPRMLGMIAMQQGPQILQMYAGQGGVNAALKDAGSLAATLVTRLGPIAAVAGLGALAISNMRGELEKTEGRAVTFGETFKGVMQVVWSDITSLIKAAVDPIAPYFQVAFDQVMSLAKDAGNTIINSFHAAYVDVEYIWNQFPNMIGTVVIDGLNAVVGGVEDMLNSVTDRMNSWIDALNERLTAIMGPGRKFERFGRVDFGPDLPNPYAGPLGDATEDRNRRIRDIMGSDPLGDYYRSVRDRVGALLQPVGTEELGKLNEAAMKAAQDALDEANKVAMKAMDNLRSTYKDAFKGFFTDLKSGLEEGKGLWRSFADAAVNALDKIATKLMDKALDSLFDGLFGPSPSAFKDSGTFLRDIILGGAGSPASGAANDNYAPGAVTRMPLPAVGAMGGMEAYRAAIKSIESLGSGGYSAIGPTHPTLGRALGAYQVMEANIPGWSKAALGRSISADEFMRDPDLQDQIFDHRFGSYVSKYGERGAAQAWFGGEGSVGMLGRKDVLGTTVGGYGDKFMAALNKANPALEQLATNSVDASSGIGKITQSLVGGAGNGAGGLFGLGLSNFGKGFNPTRTGFMDMLGGGAGASGGSGILGWLLGLFGIPGFAVGTMSAPGGLARINEMGGEIVDLPRGSRVIPHDVSMAMARGAANQNSRPVNFSSTINNYSNAKVEETVEDDGEGGRRIVYTISDQVVSAMNKPGTSLNREMRNRGAAPRRKSRS